MLSFLYSKLYIVVIYYKNIMVLFSFSVEVFQYHPDISNSALLRNYGVDIIKCVLQM